MDNKPTYEELAQRIKTLEREIAKLKGGPGTGKADARRSRRIFENTGAGYFFIDKHGIIRDVNKSWLAMYGYASAEEVVGQHFATIQLVDDIELAKELVAGIMRGDERYMQGEFSRKCKDGSLGYHVFSSEPVTSPAGEIVGIEGFIIDSTQRKLDEEELRLQAEIAENMSEGVYLIRLDDVIIVYANPKFEKMFGYDPGEMIGKHASIVNAPTDKSPAETAEKILRVLHETGEWHGEVNSIKKDGTPFWCSANVSILNHSKHGRVLVAVHTDITERKEFQKQLRQSHKMEAVGTLAGGIAHDFNNILAIILGNVELALDDIPKDHPARHNINQVLKASHRAKELVKQILSFSRSDMGSKKPFYLCRLVEENMNVLRATIPTSVEIKTHIPVKCREDVTKCFMVLVDPTQIHQLLMNLCINAVQAMNEKGILEVRVNEIAVSDTGLANRPGLEPGAYECLSVSDTGCGIDQETVEKIFDPFFTTKEVGQGTGMGLAITHGIIESHDGKVFVESEPGNGTTFHIYFPVTEEKQGKKTGEIDTMPTGSARILFVDDEEALADLGSRILERLGYTVTTLTSSTEALETFKSQPDNFDLIITDMAMPDLTGAELTVEVLKIKPDIPIILCTGYSSLISKENAEEIGIREFCMKPMDKEQLARAIRKVLDEK